MKHKIKKDLYTLKNEYLFKIDCKKNDIGATINTTNKKFQNISFDGNMFIWQNDPKKDNSPKSKVNTLAC